MVFFVEYYVCYLTLSVESFRIATTINHLGVIKNVCIVYSADECKSMQNTRESGLDI